MFNPITIRILRRCHTEQRPEFDDKITIQKLTENRLKVTYVEKSGLEPIVDISYMGYHQFLTYMYRVFYLLAIDDDPFLSLQLMIPGYPSTLVTIPSLKWQTPHLLELLSSALYTWPHASTQQQNNSE